MLKIQSPTTPPKKSKRFSTVANLMLAGLKKKDYSQEKIIDESVFTSFNDFMNYISGLSDEEVQKMLISILKKDPSFRLPFEILFLKHSLQNLNFFKEVKLKISEENFNELFKELRVESHLKGSILFNYGDTGKKLYVILQGSVFVLVPRLKVSKREEGIVKRLNESMRNNFMMEECEEEEFVKKKEGAKKDEVVWKRENEVGRREEGAFHLKKDEGGKKEEERRESDMRRDEKKIEEGGKKEDINTPLAEEGLIDGFPNFRIANLLREGALFGEISLSLKEPRAATVICRENSYFCVLKANVYEKILKVNYEQELAFLQRVSLFRELSIPNLAILMGYLQEKEYSKDFVVYKEGQEDDYLYIIKQGEVEFFKKVTFNSNVKLNIVLNEALSTVSQEKLAQVKKRNVSFGKLGQGQIFGDEEIFFNCKRSSTAIVTSSHAKLMRIEKNCFLSNLKSIKIFALLEKELQTKRKWRNRLLRQIREMTSKTISTGFDIKEKFKEVLNQEEGKTRLLTALSLKNMKNHEKEIEKRGLKSDREVKEDGRLGIEISPILKMCAVSSSFSKFQNKKSKGMNSKALSLNYENEIRAKIEFLVGQRNEKTVKLKQQQIFQKYNTYKSPDTDEKERLCDSLRMKNITKSRFLGNERESERPATKDKGRTVNLNDLDKKVIANLKKKREFVRKLREKEERGNFSAYSNYY